MAAGGGLWAGGLPAAWLTWLWAGIPKAQPRWHRHPNCTQAPSRVTAVGPAGWSRSGERWCRPSELALGTVCLPARTCPTWPCPSPPSSPRNASVTGASPSHPVRPSGGRTAGNHIGVSCAVISHLHACSCSASGEAGPAFSGQRLHPAQEENSHFPTKTLTVKWPGLGSSVQAAALPWHPALPRHVQPRANPAGHTPPATPLRPHSPLQSCPSQGKAEELERLQVVASGAVTSARSMAGWEIRLVKKFGFIP